MWRFFERRAAEERAKAESYRIWAPSLARRAPLAAAEYEADAQRIREAITAEGYEP